MNDDFNLDDLDFDSFLSSLKDDYINSDEPSIDDLDSFADEDTSSPLPKRSSYSFDDDSDEEFEEQDEAEDFEYDEEPEESPEPRAHNTGDYDGVFDHPIIKEKKSRSRQQEYYEDSEDEESDLSPRQLRKLEKQREKERAAEEKRLEKERIAAEKQRAKDDAEMEKERRKMEKAQQRAAHKTERIIRWIVMVVVFAAIIGGAVYGGITVTNSPKIYPKITASDVDIGGMTKEQATSALTAAGWESRASDPLIVTTIGGITAEFDPGSAGTDLTVEKLVDEAYNYGRSSNIISNLFSYIECYIRPTDMNSLKRIVNSSYITEVINNTQLAIDNYLGEDEYTVDAENSVLLMKKGQGELELNTNGMYNAVLTALENGEKELTYTELAVSLASPDFNSIHTALQAEPQDAYYSDDGKFEVTDEVVGCEFDVSAAQQLWNAAAPGDEVQIPLDITYPEVTGDELRSRLYGDLLGAMTTRYTNSGENRCSNLRLACSKINGTILYPGDEFSFNDFIGKRTEEAGFLPAPAYASVGEDGVKDEIGGGCCQVSSTLYSATLFSFLEIVERHNHVYPVNYIQVGMDATVTIPEEGNEMDFIFKNNKNYPIKIVGYTTETDEEKTITFEIWGTLEDDDLMPIEFDNSYSWTLDYDRVIDPADADREGYKIKLTHETYSFADEIGPGIRTLSHREVYDSEGNLVSDEILNPLLASGNPGMDTYYNHNS